MVRNVTELECVDVDDDEEDYVFEPDESPKKKRSHSDRSRALTLAGARFSFHSLQVASMDSVAPLRK